MEERINPFRKSGVVLLIIGLLDIAFMGYCVANNMSYSSSFNIFAVIAGIFLIRGSVKTARVIRWFSAFCVTAFLGVLLVTPIITPPGLLLAQLRIDPVTTIGSYLFSIVFIGVLI